MKKASNTRKRRANENKLYVRPVRPNLGAEAAYRRRLKKQTKRMANSAEYWLAAWYKRWPPRLATDASPANEVSKRLQALAKKWQKRFNEFAVALAPLAAKEFLSTSDKAFAKALKNVGFTVSFKMTREQQDVMAAVIAENVNLIKSIPAEYFKDVNYIVTTGFTRGRDLNYITKEIKSRYGLTERRATLIARDQCNKATSAFNRARQLEINADTAQWVHTSSAKKPRPDHVAANGKEYNIKQGCLISGEYILPGQLINCGCISRTVIKL